MMLIPQPVGLGPNDNHKTAYFADSTGSSPSIVATVSGSSNAGAVNGPQAVFSYPAADGCLIPGRMQSELSGLNMYGAQAGSSALASPTNYGAMPGAVATAPGLITPHYGSAGIEHSPYYSALGPSYDMKPAGGEMWTGAYPQPPPGYYPYDNTFGPQYPYDRYCSMDMNDGVRRKNATRESTNTLKTWLQEHKKNPYPTKGEKIMLAIITKMTLTQVSTWFANARRRLKKENKMTWVPKNRSNESSGGSQQDKKEDGDDDDSQHNDDGDKSENGHGGDSDDSAEREVTSTNNNDSLNSSFPHQQDPAVFDDERVDSYNSGPASAHSSNDKTSSVSYPTQRDGDFATAGNLTCDPGHDRFIPPEGPNRGIWSPVNDHQRPFPVIGAPERHDMEHNPGYASQYSASAFGGPGAIVPRHQHGIVSPPDLTEPGDGQPRADFHYPPAQSWSEHGYPSSNSNTLRAAPESCSIGGGGGSESTDGRTDVGSPGDYQRQYACIDPYQRVGGGGSQAKELYLGHPGMYTQARGREIPGTSPNPSNLGRSVDPVSPYASAEYGHVVDYYTVDRLPPPPAVGATGPFFPRQGDRMQTSTNLYTQGEQPGAALDTEASPSPAVISPPNSRPVFLPHRYGQIGVGGPYYGQAPSSCTSTSMFGAPYYPADGAGSDMRPQVHPSPIVDVTGKQQPAMSSLSPPVNQSTFSRSPASTSPSVVEHRASPNAQRDVQETLANHGSR